jgi:hypothetical protein
VLVLQPCPHAPQSVFDVMAVSHPVSGLLEQLAKPVLHADASNVHTPLEQVTVPVTFFKVEQS